MNNLVWTFSWLCMILGAIMIAAGKASRSYRKKIEPYKGRATGRVVELVPGMPDEKGLEAGIHDYYYPVIAYYAKGRLYKERYPVGGNPCPFRVSQELPLYYDLEEPVRFKIAEGSQLKTISRILYFGGIGVCILGVVLFLLFAMRIL